MTIMLEYTDETLREMGFGHAAATEDNWETINTWRKKQYTANNTGISSRVINYWLQTGVLTDIRSDDRGWHKFTLMDILFVGIATRLRKIGLSNGALKRTYRALFCLVLDTDIEPNTDDYYEKRQESLTLLEFALWRSICMSGDGNIYLLVFDDGGAAIMTQRDILKNQQSGCMPSTYITINLNDVFDETFINRAIAKHVENTTWLNNGEKDLIDAVNEAPKNSIVSAKKHDGQIDCLEIEYSHNKSPEDELHKIINGIGFGSVEVSIRNGKIIHIKQGKKRKVTK